MSLFCKPPITLLSWINIQFFFYNWIILLNIECIIFVHDRHLVDFFNLQVILFLKLTPVILQRDWGIQ